MVITCFHHSWSWSRKLVQFESGDGLTGNQVIQSEYRLAAMACAYFLEKQRKKVKPNLKLMALLDLHMNHGSRCWAIPCCYVDCMKCFKSSRKIHNTVFNQTAMAPSTDTSQWHPAWHHVQTVKVCQTHPQLLHAIGIHQWHATTWHPAMAPYHDTQHPAMAPTMASSNGTLPRHPAMGPRLVCQSVITTPRLLHPAMAPSNGTLPHGTQQWHLTMAPSTTSSLSKCVITSPPLASSNGSSNGTQHPAMASYHMAPTMASSNGTLPWHLTMAPSNGTTSSLLHPAMAPYHMAPSTGQHAAMMAPNNDTHHGILPSHLTMAASNGTTSSLSPPIASSNGTQQRNLTTWHRSNGTQQWGLGTSPEGTVCTMWWAIVPRLSTAWWHVFILYKLWS